MPDTMRARRSCLAVPGSNARFLDKAKGLDADQVFLDLEDSVAPIAKVEARTTVVEALNSGGWGDKVRVVRMGIPDRLVTHGDPKLLLAKYGLDADGIYTRVKESVDVLDDRRAKAKTRSR